jgi:hypothetical protein
MVDQRATLDLESLFRQWKAQPGTLIWREGDSVPLRETRARDALEACETLVVWTTPCSDRDWSAALAIAQPKTVILIAADPEWDTPQRFLQRLAALVRGMLPSGGAVDLNRLAAGTAQPVTAVTCGLNWLIAKGYIHVAAMTETGYRVQPGGTPQPERLPRFEKDLTIILQESAAYRAYFRRADPRRLADARPPHSA